MHDDIAELVLTGRRFDDQPLCWQNMVHMLSRQDSYFHYRFVESVREHLVLFNLEYVDNEQLAPSVVKGALEDLTAWMLTYA